MQPACTRREFLATCTWGLFAMHEAIADMPAVSADYRLLRIRMSCAAPLDDMEAFYGRVLEMTVSRPDRNTLRVMGGRTELTFTAADAPARPFYHFAFNIPENKIAAAHEWQQRRTPLLPIPTSLRDPSLPPHVVHYRHWNAHSIFFFDPAGNVVEYIARHDLRNAAAGPFAPADMLCASEIAFVADDVLEASKRIAAAAGLEPYGAASDNFVALGDARGLVLVMKRGRVISFESARKSAVDVFPTSVVVRGDRPRTERPLTAFPYEISIA